jgi:predicted transposase YdaD
MPDDKRDSLIVLSSSFDEGISGLIYLKKGGPVATSPLIRTLPDGEEFLRFRFHVIQLWDIPYEELMAKELPGLLPLVPLAKGGAKREVIEEIIVRLTTQGGPARKELLALTRLFASLAFDNQEDQEWLERRFEMLRDILRDTPAYQQLLEEGREEERQKSIQLLSQNLLDVV